MILWWGKKGAADPRTGETPVTALKPGETPNKLAPSLDEQIFGAQAGRSATAADRHR